MSMKLTRSASVDSSVYRPVSVDKKLSELVSALRTVHTTSEMKSVKTDNELPKFDLLKFRNQYRESVATNVMSALSDDFKQAYETGDNAQKRNLENVAVAVYLAKAHHADEGRDDVQFGKLVNKWLEAIKNGNKNPGCHFSVEQNFSVNRKNKERDSYHKAVNELGLYLKENFAGPKALAKAVMVDVRKKCSDVLSFHGIDISTVSKYLEQTAFNAEKNMCHSIAHLSSPGREGTVFLKHAAIHINSMLNYPNYLREILSRADNSASQRAAPPVEPEGKDIPAVKPEDKNISPTVPANPPVPERESFYPSGATPVVNLSNIGNPTIHIDLGDKLEKLLERGNNVYHIHHYHICHCQHVHGSSVLPHNFSLFTHTGTTQTANVEPERYPSGVTLTRPIMPSIRGVSSTDFIDSTDTDDGADVVDGRSVNSALSSFADSANDTTDNVATDKSAADRHENVGHSVDDDNQALSDNIQPASERIPAYERTFKNNGLLTEPVQISTPGITASLKPMPNIDTFIAKEERAGGAVTLSAQGLRRPNNVGNDTASFTRQSGLFTSTLVDAITNQPESDLQALHNIQLSENEESDNTFISTATLTLHQRNKALEFDNPATLRQQVRRSTSLSDEFRSNNIVNNSTTVQGDGVNRMVSNDDSTLTNTAAISSLRGAEQVSDATMPERTQQNPPDARIIRPYSAYLDEKGNPKSPVTLTVDGLHRPRY